MSNSTTGERVTAAVSTVVAIVLLGAAVTAGPAPGPSAGRMQSLESDLRFQLELAFRADGPERQRRLEQLDAALAAWQAAPRGPRAEQAMIAWLQSALDNSMPGRGGEFPAPPDFGPPPTASTPAQATRAASAAPPAPRESAGPAGLRPPTETSGPPSPHPTPASPQPTLAQPTAPVARRPAPPPPAAVAVVESGPPSAPRTTQRPIIISVSPPAPIIDGAPELPLALPSPASPDKVPAAEHSIAARPSSPSPPSRTNRTLPPAPVATETPYAAASAVLSPASPEPPTEPATPAFADAGQFDTAPVELPPTIRVNLRELNARIHGYHQTLGEIESATIVASPVSERQLEPLVAKLESLAGQYQLVQLYYETLSEGERRKVATPRAMHDAIELVNRHVQAANASLDIFAEFDAADEASASETPLAERLRKVAEATGSSGD